MTAEQKPVRYGEDWWTPEDVENGFAPHNAVFDPAYGVYREVIGDDGEDGEDDGRGLRWPSAEEAHG